MDMFDIRMSFLNSLRRLNATQSSIQRVVGFAIKHFARCGEDLWDCVLEECQKGSLNMRINILYCLDSLCEASLHYQSSIGSGQLRSSPTSYVEYVSRDLDKIVQLVVPDNRDGLVNLASTRQILESWRAKRVLDSAVIEDVVKMLDGRSESLHEKAASEQSTASTEFTREEILRRFEEDRERHKLLRQKRWVLPIPSQIPSHQPRLATALLTSASASTNVSPASPASPAQTSQIPSHRGQQQHPQQSSMQTSGPELALDIEFENAWETTSDWNEDDEEAVREENALCFPEDFLGRTERMDVS
ncbi:hypothetical protein M407DRAFT_69697 [Tulasnella calospora MUT 4182]|uniref:CID domain-containing protein n=1 Tax=Tulasnella calospora MUT 4182 TaxID=1051891 RepID=A0A0C3L870_9AGAM|nr:hypothetical protein M407DRAFT_69697 [Tulasnella calospora MUT 4182]